MRFWILALVLPACVALSTNRIDTRHLKGGWTSHGGGFEFQVKDHTILYEFDMKEHPYKIKGGVLIVDFQNDKLGIQRNKILHLTETELELKDLRLKPGDPSTLFRRPD